MRDNTCIYPGCGRSLRRGNITNFCKDHNAHSAYRDEGFCQCRRCQGLAVNRERDLPANVRQVMVQIGVGYSTADAKFTPVSLPKEPWKDA